MIRIGFVGAGAMGQCAHLANYTDLPGCDVVALAECREDLGRRVAARYGIPSVYRDHRAMLSAEKLDAIVASQPFERHGRLLPELYETGLPLFTEKPLARSFDVGKSMIDVLERTSSRHVLGYHKRSDPATLYARECLDRYADSGEMGALNYIRIAMPEGDWMASGFAHLLQSDEATPTDEDPAPANLDSTQQERFWVFVNYYIHQVNLFRYLFGEPYDVEYVDPRSVVMAVRSRSGVPGVLEMSPYRTTVDWQEEVLICFEKGYIRLTLPAPLAINRPGSVELLRDPGDGAAPERIRPHLPWVHAMRQQAIHFIRFVDGEATPLCTAQEALDDLRIAADYIARLERT